uniref:DUF1618 domain-containing protein n=2 Tax=Aegilops tauschii subsp. strangulata TaxID=200361 RepID=A0A452XVI2_AEGTS
MAGSLMMSGSFDPPAADPAGANPSRYPFWVLLDSTTYFANRDNATTVKGTTSAGHEFKNRPRVLCLQGCIHGKSIIQRVPPSPAYKHQWLLAVVPREGDNFLVADLSPGGDLGHYNLHIFSSETKEWSTKHLQLQAPSDVLSRDLPSQTDKVISLGANTVGWVDLWRGIVVCDVLQKDPVLRFLPLPKADFDLHRESPARQVRDVIGFPDGFINFVEIEQCVRWFTVVRKRTSKTTHVFDVADTISDAELLSNDGMDTEDEPFHAPAGWKIRTMFRSIYWHLWQKSRTVHVDHISPCPPESSKLTHHLWNDRDMKWTLGNLKTAGFPTLSVYGGNTVYLVSKVESQDEDTLLVGVDIGKRKLEVIEQYCCGRSISFNPYPLGVVQIVGGREVIEPYCGGRSTAFNPISCAFSEYLNTTPSPRHVFCFALFSILLTSMQTHCISPSSQLILPHAPDILPLILLKAT